MRRLRRVVASVLALSMGFGLLNQPIVAERSIDSTHYDKVWFTDTDRNNQMNLTLDNVDIDKEIDYKNNTIKWTMKYNKNHENYDGYVLLGLPSNIGLEGNINITRKSADGRETHRFVRPSEIANNFKIEKNDGTRDYIDDFNYIKSVHRDKPEDAIKVASNINWWNDSKRIGSILRLSTDGSKDNPKNGNTDQVTFEFTTKHKEDLTDFREGLDFMPGFIAVVKKHWRGFYQFPRIVFIGPFGKKGQHNLQMPDPIIVNDKTRLTESDKHQLIASLLQKTDDYYYNLSTTSGGFQQEHEDLKWVKQNQDKQISVENNGLIRVKWQDKTQSVRGDVHNFVRENKAPTINLAYGYNEKINQTIEYGTPIQPVEIIASDEDKTRGQGALSSPNGQNFKVVKHENGKYVDTDLPKGLKLEDNTTVGTGNKVLTGTPTELDFSNQEKHTLTITVIATDDMGKQSEPKTITINVTKPTKPDVTKDLDSVRQKAQEKQNAIDADNELNDKQGLKDKVAEALRKAEETLNKAQTSEEVEKAKQAFEEELTKIDQEITKQKALKKAKDDAINEIETAKKAMLDDIKKKYDDKVITAEEKKKYEDEIVAKVEKAIREINSSNDLAAINNKKDETIRDITSLPISGTKKNEALSALEAHKNKIQIEIDKIKNQEEKAKRQQELNSAYEAGKKAINEATTDANVDTALNKAKAEMDKVIKKQEAIDAINAARTKKLADIESKKDDLSQNEKTTYETEVNKLANDAIKAINDGTATDIDQKKTETVSQINAVKPLVREKAIDAITTAKDNKLKKINEAFNLGKITTEEKDKYIKTATDLATEAIGKIKVAGDQSSIEQIKTDTVSTLENHTDIVGTKKDEAKQAVLNHAQAKKGEIAKIVGLSQEEIKRRQDEVDAVANQAIAEIDKITTNTDSLVEKAKNKGISDINKVVAKQKAIDDIEAYKKQKQADIDAKKKDLTPDERMERKKLVAEEANKTIEAIKKVADEMEINPLVTNAKTKIDEIVNNENTYKKELEDEINKARVAKKKDVQADAKLSEDEKNKFKNELDKIADDEIARLKDDETSPKNTLKNQVDTVIEKINNFQTPGKDLAKEKIDEALRTKLSLVTGEKTKDLTLTIEEREEQKAELNKLSDAAKIEIEAAKTQAEIDEIIKKYTDKDTGLIAANKKEGIKKPEANSEIKNHADKIKAELKTKYPNIDEKYLTELESLATSSQEDINKTDLTNKQVAAKKELAIKTLDEVKEIIDALSKKLKEIAEKAETNKISTEGENSEKAKYEKEAKKLAEEAIEAIKELSKTASDEISADKDNFEANLAGKKTEIETKKTETLTAIKKIKVISLDIPKNKIKAAKKKKQKEIEDDKTKLTTDEKDKLLEKLANKEQEALAALDKLAKDNENQLDTETDKIQEAINSSADTSIKTIEAIKIEDHAKNKREAITELQKEKEKITAEIEEEFKQKYPNLDEKYVRKYQEEIASILEKESKEITDGENLSNASVTAKKDLAKKKMAGVKNLAFVTGAKLQAIVDDIRLTIEEKEAEQEKIEEIAEQAFLKTKEQSVNSEAELETALNKITQIENEAITAIKNHEIIPVQKPEAIKELEAERDAKLKEITDKFATGIISETEKQKYEEIVKDLASKAKEDIETANNISNDELRANKEEVIENIKTLSILGREKPSKAIYDALASKTQAIESDNNFTTEEKHEHIERLTGLAKETIKTIENTEVLPNQSLEDVQKNIEDLKNKTIAEINKEIEPRHKPAKIKELEAFSNKFIAEKIEAKDALSDQEKAKYSKQVKDIVAKYIEKINDTKEEINLAGLEELVRQAKAEIEGLNLTARDKSKDEIDNYAKGYISFINRELNHLSLAEQEEFIKRIEEIAAFYKKLIDDAMSDEEVLDLLKKAIEAMKKTVIDAGLLNDVRKPDLPSLADENKNADKKLKDRQPKTGVTDGQFGIATMVFGLALAFIMSRKKVD